MSIIAADPRRFIFKYRVEVPASPTSVRLWIPVPGSDEFQTVGVPRVQMTERYEFRDETQYGNRILYAGLAPSQLPRHIDLEVEVERRARLGVPAPDAPFDGSFDRSQFDLWLRANSEVPTGGFVGEAAAQVTEVADSPRLRSKKIFDHLLATFDYDYRGCTPERQAELGNLAVACSLKTATCTDFHGLFVGYVRSLGVPARFAFGFNVPRKPEGKIAGYHCWSEIFLPRVGWYAVDVSEAWKKEPSKRDFYFGSIDQNRVQFTCGRDIILAPSQAGEPVGKFIFPYAESNGEPFEVHPTFSFEDLILNSA